MFSSCLSVNAGRGAIWSLVFLTFWVRKGAGVPLVLSCLGVEGRDGGEGYPKPGKGYPPQARTQVSPCPLTGQGVTPPSPPTRTGVPLTPQAEPVGWRGGVPPARTGLPSPSQDRRTSLPSDRDAPSHLRCSHSHTHLAHLG